MRYAQYRQDLYSESYVKQHKHAVYVDCSQVKTKLKLIRYIAKEFGVTSNGRYSDVYEDLVATSAR